MKAVTSLTLLLTCIAINAENEGASDKLKSKWLEGHTVLNKFYSRRCTRSCSPLDDDLFWVTMKENVALSLSGSEYVEYMTKLYNGNRLWFIHSLRQNVTSGTKYLDADHSGIISAEEFYSEFLCLGWGLEPIKKLYDIQKPNNNGIPNDRLIDSWVEHMTTDVGTDAIFDMLKNGTYNDTSHI